MGLGLDTGIIWTDGKRKEERKEKVERKEGRLKGKQN
jgi:hypothetical protein